MSEWYIVAWSRESGRGLVSSPHFQNVPFDASCADVDDFKLGEHVHVETVRTGAELKIRRIWPDLPRFRPQPGGRCAEPLAGNWRRHAEEVLARWYPCFDWRLSKVAAEELCIQGDDNAFE
jgi:hypothetical protein